MITNVVPLGTASAIPTRDRHLSALALEREGRVYLFDCGEGTQYQFLRADLNRARVDAIFITHMHGDHLFGLMGFLSSMALLKRTDPVTLVGPEGLLDVLHAMPGANPEHLPYPLAAVELAPGVTHATVLETDAFTVEARPLDHGVFTVGYRFQERTRPGHLQPDVARDLGVTDYAHFRRLKGGKPVTLDDGTIVQPEQVLGPERPGISVAYVTDTRPCDGGQRLADRVDLLYHEATFTDDMHDRAVETGHSTAREAAQVALDAGAKRLLISHFSARYDTPTPLVQEAQAVFSNTEAAQELKRYALDARDKEPEPTDGAELSNS